MLVKEEAGEQINPSIRYSIRLKSSICVSAWSFNCNSNILRRIRSAKVKNCPMRCKFRVGWALNWCQLNIRNRTVRISPSFLIYQYFQEIPTIRNICLIDKACSIFVQCNYYFYAMRYRKSCKSLQFRINIFSLSYIHFYLNDCMVHHLIYHLRTRY